MWTKTTSFSRKRDGKIIFKVKKCHSLAVRPDWAIFQKFVLINFRTKVVQLFGDFREHYENIPLKVKAALVTFWATSKHLG